MKSHGRAVCILVGPASLMLISILHFGGLENRDFREVMVLGGARR